MADRQIGSNAAAGPLNGLSSPVQGIRAVVTGGWARGIGRAGRAAGRLAEIHPEVSIGDGDLGVTRPLARRAARDGEKLEAAETLSRSFTKAISLGWRRGVPDGIARMAVIRASDVCAWQIGVIIALNGGMASG